MRRVRRIIHQETQGPILLTLLILTFVVFAREFGRLVELLIRRNAEVTTVLKAVVFLLPSILVFTVPFAFLIGTLIGFSRLSADSEVVAMRAGGISVTQLLWPVLRKAALVAAVTASFTFLLMPEGNWRLRLLRHEIRLSPAFAQIKPRVFFEEFPGILLYVEDISPQSSTWKEILVADSSEGGGRRFILARTGESLTSEEGQRLQFHFDQGSTYDFRFDLPENLTVSQFDTLDFPVDLPAEASAEREKVKRPQDKTTEDLLTDIRQGTPQEHRSALVEMHRRMALPVASFIFGILAVTLGIRAPQGGRGYGFILSVTVAFTYYILFATGTTLSRNGVLPIPVGVWGADIALGLVALATLRTAEKESRVLHRFFNSRPIVFLESQSEKVGNRLRVFADTMSTLFQERLLPLPNLRFRAARIIDLFMVRTFLGNLLSTLVVLLSLVCLFTFFEIVDNVFENDIPYGVVVDYFFFLQPHLLMLLVPVSILIATLVTFGSLERFNQIIAFKSCGISVYRIALPVLVLSVFLGGFTFVMQEYVLPYANQRQDNLRKIITGRPAQTSTPGRHWVFGEDGRLYNYSLFSSKWNIFLDLAVYRVDLAQSRILEIVYAERAEWDRSRQAWLFHGGWSRNLPEGSFEFFQSRHFFTPETPDFFDEEVRDSSKMTFDELRQYIEDLEVGGFEVDYLKTELYKKLSFPVVNVIMALLGVPFALTMGKKGALYGIAAGVILGIAYWGAFGAFDVLGGNGLLAPALAAWGPNIVFGAGATLLLSLVRT